MVNMETPARVIEAALGQDNMPTVISVSVADTEDIMPVIRSVQPEMRCATNAEIADIMELLARPRRAKTEKTITSKRMPNGEITKDKNGMEPEEINQEEKFTQCKKTLKLVVTLNLHSM